MCCAMTVVPSTTLRCSRLPIRALSPFPGALFSEVGDKSIRNAIDTSRRYLDPAAPPGARLFLGWRHGDYTVV